MNTTVRFHAIGGPETLALDDVGVPEPAAGQVRIATRAWGLNRADVMFRTGNHFAAPVLPQAQGLEASGTIDAVGSGVDGFTVGDVVSVVPAFSLTDYALHGQLVLAPARAVVKHPTELSWEQAAALWMPFTTAYGALVDIGGLKCGDVVTIPAASSSVGLAALQITRQVGARPIAISRSADKRDALLNAGAEAVIVSNEEDVTARLLDLTDGDGVDLVFDPVAGPGLTDLLRAAAQHATVIVYGALDPEPTQLQVLELMQKRLTIRGYDVVEVIGDDERLARAIDHILVGVRAGALVPTVDRTFAAAEVQAAYTYLEAGGQIGKVVVTAPGR